MSDNVVIPATGSGDATPIVATDEVGTAHYQRMKLDAGGDGLSVPIVAGQQLAAASIPVVLTAAQITTLTPPAAITGYALAANQQTDALTDTQLRATAVPVSGTLTANIGTVGTLATAAKQDTGNTSVASIDTKTPALGQALAAASVPIVLTAAQLSTLTPPAAITGFLTETDFDTKAGSLTEVAPATDTASSGLNGRLQRIAQRLSSLITALGSPLQAGGSIGNTSFASTVADGANVTLGAKADAKSTATDTTAITAMSVWKQISASVQSLVTNLGTVVFGAGTAAAAQRTTLASDDPAVATLGATTGSAVITDANGTIQQYLRGLVKLAITAGGWLVTATLAAGSQIIGKVGIDQTTPGTTNLVAVAAKAILWQAAWNSRGTVLTTELNALGDGAFSAVGTAIDNATNLDQFGALDIVLASLNPTAGAFLQVFMVQSLDGTNYEDAPSSTNPGLHMLIATVNVTTGSAAKRIMTPTFRLPAGKVKFVLYNDTNVSLGANSNTVTLYTSNDEVQ